MAETDSVMTDDEIVRGRQIVASGKHAPSSEHNGQHTDLAADAPSLLGGMVDGAWLDAQEFPPLRWTVCGILPEGFGLLVGPPKLGKSWFVAGIGLACAAGGLALGRINVEQRPVLYLALEDGHRRLQDRFRRIMAGLPIPPLINVITNAQRQEVLPMIAEFLARQSNQHPLIILDTLGKVKPHKRAGEDSYTLDYAIGGALKAAIDAAPGASLLVVHHTRKADSADFIDSVSGTQGIAGSADYVLVLKRTRHSVEATLAVTGRDVREAEYALHVDEGMFWRLDGTDLSSAALTVRTRAEKARLGDRALEVLALVNQCEQTITPAKVAAKLGISHKRAGESLARLYEAGRIRKTRRGIYARIATAESAETAENAGQSINLFPYLKNSSAESAENKTAPDQQIPYFPHFPHIGAEAERRTDGQDAGFTPPTGPGRCEYCGFHVATQGHRDDCSANEEDPF
jgi:hypothetical protein